MNQRGYSHSTNISEQEIIELYEHTQNYYSKESMSMHCGIWDEDTKTLHEANLNTNRIISETLNISAKDKVLDAGCGVGGTSIFIAQRYGANVIGITLLKKQVELANAYKDNFNLNDLVSFEQADYTNTHFQDNTFDKILSIECVCHALHKRDYLEETYRILKTGGKIAILDAYLIRNELEPKEVKIYNRFKKGFVLDNLATVKSFQDDMQDVGFKNIKFLDMTSKVRKSTKQYYWMAGIAHPFVYLLEKLNIVPKHSAGHFKSVQYTHLLVGNKLKRDIAVYGIFIAEK